VRFIDEQREPQLVSISADSNLITRLAREDGAELPVFRLDPPVIGSVFPIHGDLTSITASTRTASCAHSGRTSGLAAWCRAEVP
jgi:hypothetical protein